MTKKELKIIYELKHIIEKLYANELHDHNNPMQADKRKDLYEQGVKKANEILFKYPPL